MQQTLRPYVTTGVAIVGVAVVAVVPAAPQFLDGQRAFTPTQQQSIRLSAGGGDPFTPWADLFTNTAANLQALGSHAFEFPILQQLLADPGGSISHIPDVIALLTNVMPTIGVDVLPLPAQLTADLPVWLSQTLSQLGPLVTVINAIQSIGGQVADGNALTALIGAPATLLNAYLNGTDSVDVMGASIPLWNGVLVPGQAFDLHLNVGEIVDALGFGDKTIPDLLGDFGNQSVQALLTELLDSTGVGQLTPVGLLDQLGIGQETVVKLIDGLVGSTDMGDKSIAALLDQFGYGGDTTVASLLVSLLNSSEIGNPTITELLDQFGYGDATLGGLIKDMLAPTGMGSTPLPDLVDPNLTLGGLLNDMLGDSTVTDLLTTMGMGDTTLTGLVTSMMGDFGTLSLLDMMGLGYLGAGFDPNELLVDLMNSILPPGYDFNELLAAGDFDTLTLGEMINMFPVDTETLQQYNFDFANWTGAQNPTYGEIPFTLLMSIVGVGDTPLATLSPDNASLINKIGNPTLNALLGTNDVNTTLQNLHMYDVTMGQMLQAVGIGNFQISDLLHNLTLGPNYVPVTLGEFVTAIGFNPDLNTILERLLGSLGIGDRTLVDLFSAWGLNNLPMSTVIDQLGFNTVNLHAILGALGLGNLDLDMVIDRLGLSNIQITTLLDNLGLNTVHLDTVINSVFGSLTLGPILNNLGLDDVTLSGLVNSLTESLLGDTTLSSVLAGIGMDTNTLDSIVGQLLAGLGLSGATINSLLGDLGIDSVDVNAILDGMGLSGVDAVNVQTGDFFGLLAQELVNLPQQIAAALGAA